MSESQAAPGKKQAIISANLAVIAFLYLILVPIYITSFFTLALGIVGLVQAIRARRMGYNGWIRVIGLLLSTVDIAVSAILIAVLIIALIDAGGEPLALALG